MPGTKNSTIEVTEEKEKEVMTLDDDETFSRFYSSISPTTLSSAIILDEEEDFSIIQSDMPKWDAVWDAAVHITVKKMNIKNLNLGEFLD